MSARETTILVIDDEPQIRRLLKTSLAPHKFAVAEAGTAAAGLKRLGAETIDLVILDLGLPDRGGLTVIEAIRKDSALPIIVLSVRSDEETKVQAFELGADDYVTKPFGMAELLSRIRAALRHRFQAQGTLPLLKCGAITINLVDRWVRHGDTEIKLSPTEYEILHLLAEHQGKILTHDFIRQKIWDDENADIQYLRVYIRALRQKLGEGGAMIQTEQGIGYRLVAGDGEG
ncbi:MAG TPA: response regulator transcription factor [Stellaceae bacterium]|jgi:two-component system KDP operon response regulator KdpE|nr:response regulator transcription factor [Stellaceae bacterium]